VCLALLPTAARGASAAADEPGVVARVSSRFDPAPLPADGTTEATLVLELRDAWGAPLEHVEVVSVASHGALGAARERGQGVYEHAYRPPAEVPEGDAFVQVTDAAGSFVRLLRIPLRPAGSPPVFLGAGAGYTRSPGTASGPRGQLEAWVPFGGPALRLGAGLTAGLGRATKTVSDRDGTLRSRSEATFVPVALRLGWDALAGRRVSVIVGGGAAAAFAEVRTSISSEVAHGVGFGWLGFADVALTLGAGQLVLGASYGAVPVHTARFRIDPGGLAGTVGYRVAAR
jgi:hypothetical protein